MNTYGINHNIWSKWTRTERITALAYLIMHAPLMKTPSEGAAQLTADHIAATGCTPGKGNHLVARMDAKKRTERLRNHLGELDTKILWSVICLGGSLKETAEWLFGDNEQDARYTGRRVRTALEEAAKITGTTNIDIATTHLMMKVAA